MDVSRVGGSVCTSHIVYSPSLKHSNTTPSDGQKLVGPRRRLYAHVHERKGAVERAIVYGPVKPRRRQIEGFARLRDDQEAGADEHGEQRAKRHETHERLGDRKQELASRKLTVPHAVDVEGAVEGEGHPDRARGEHGISLSAKRWVPQVRMAAGHSGTRTAVGKRGHSRLDSRLNTALKACSVVSTSRLLNVRRFEPDSHSEDA